MTDGSPDHLVRGLLPGDAAAVGEVHAAAWADAYAALIEGDLLARAVASRRGTGDALVGRLHGDGTGVLADGSVSLVAVAVASGSVVGFAHAGAATEADGETAEIYALYVAPGAWGTGAAQRLWSATLATPAVAGTSRITLWTLEGAARAHRFYQRRGMRRTGSAREHDFGDGLRARIVEFAGVTQVTAEPGGEVKS